MRTLNLALAQMNHVVGDFEGNFRKIVKQIDLARKADVDVIAFPEMCLTGYPPEDLLLKPEFIQENLRYLKKFLPYTEDIAVIIGFVNRGDDIYNAAAVLYGGEVLGIYHKIFLPNYGVFDENRYFQAGQKVQIFIVNDVRIGVNICEDIWYPGGPTREQALYGGAEVIINISSSPYHYGKAESRFRMLSTRAEDDGVIVAYVNTVGGQDELVFDGNSMIISEDGQLLGKSPAFEEDLLLLTLYPENVFNKRIHDPRKRKEKLSSTAKWELDIISSKKIEGKKNKKIHTTRIADFPEENAEVYQALIMGLRDYVIKNRFKKVLVGISGGIDSALVATLAVDALGAENVIGVSMHSQYTSDASKTDARQLAKNAGFELLEIPIDTLYQDFLSQMKPVFKNRKADITEENIQARIRGNILMALSNKFGWLVLATGNKSEISVGYCTLYGDMVGGFSVIKDVYKTMVYQLAEFRNRKTGREIIPKRIISKEPSAELKPDQKDTDSLPSYDILDPILRAYVEDDLSPGEIEELGYEPKLVEEVIQLVDRNEYKRRQGAPGIKISYRAFGKDRRFPITNRF